MIDQKIYIVAFSVNLRYMYILNIANKGQFVETICNKFAYLPFIEKILLPLRVDGVTVMRGWT